MYIPASRYLKQMTAWQIHYSDAITGAMASQITGVSIGCLTVLCEGNPPVTGEFPSQWDSNADNASIRWRHHVQSTDAVFLPHELTTETPKDTHTHTNA